MVTSQYHFQKQYFKWPSGYAGISYINDNGLLLAAFNALNKPKIVGFKKTIPFTRLQDLTATTTFTSAELIDAQLSINGNLRRGNTTIEGNNCLLHSYFQLIQVYFNRYLPGHDLGNLEEFISYIRTSISMTNGQMLMINDEVQGVQILSAIKHYIFENTGHNVGFDLTFLVAIDGEIALVDNIAEFQNQFGSGDFKIPIRIIQVNYNHYEPVFKSSEIIPSINPVEETKAAVENKDSEGVEPCYAETDDTKEVSENGDNTEREENDETQSPGQTAMLFAISTQDHAKAGSVPAFE